MSSEIWWQSEHLRKHTPTVADVQKLLGLVERELADSSVSGLSDDGRFMHAYDAALQLCLLALHVTGYDVGKGAGHHYYAINSLPFTLGQSEKETSEYLATCSRQRSQSLYDHAGVVSAQDAQELLDTSGGLKSQTQSRLEK